jgi:isochorismate synthase
MEETSIRLKCSEYISTGGTVAICRLPGVQQATFYATHQQPQLLRVDAQKIAPQTFLFAPYASGNLAYHLVPEETIQTHPQNLVANSTETINWYTNSHNKENDKVGFEKYIHQILTGIAKDELAKVVAARCQHHPVNPDFDALHLFANLCEMYDGAYVYFFSSPNSGTWIGASPELLFSTTKNSIQTVALAGTRTMDNKTPWEEKELDEQYFVEIFLQEAFDQVGIKNVEVSNVVDVVAGNLIHLCSTLTWNTDRASIDGKMHKILSAINPTPAVCGLPPTEASFFISANEGLERRFYSGFSGPVDAHKNIKLYVSLRCLELIENNHVALYAGAGITEQSVVEKEWQETNNKMQTLLTLLSQ